MDPEKAKLIASLIDKIPIVVPALLTSTIAIITLIIGYKNNKRQNAINLITSKRIEWQEIIRNELSDFIHDAWILHNTYCIQVEENNFNPEYFLSEAGNVTAKGNKLILRLNPIEDKKIIDIITEFFITLDPGKPEEAEAFLDNLDELLVKLRVESHIMLKKEWEKIKTEAGSKN